jgi:hypothetical protein
VTLSPLKVLRRKAWLDGYETGRTYGNMEAAVLTECGLRLSEEARAQAEESAEKRRLISS